jgi:hypothetical protein
LARFVNPPIEPSQSDGDDGDGQSQPAKELE